MIRIARLNKFSSKGGAVAALKDIDLFVDAGEFFVLLGPSGSGKTTLLRCVAGLERPDSGEIALGARVAFSSERRPFCTGGRERDRHGLSVLRDLAPFDRFRQRRSAAYAGAETA